MKQHEGGAQVDGEESAKRVWTTPRIILSEMEDSQKNT